MIQLAKLIFVLILFYKFQKFLLLARARFLFQKGLGFLLLQYLFICLFSESVTVCLCQYSIHLYFIKIKTKFFLPAVDINHALLPTSPVTFNAKQCSKWKTYQITYLGFLTSFCHGNEVIYIEKNINSAFRQNGFMMINAFTPSMIKTGTGQPF